MCPRPHGRLTDSAVLSKAACGVVPIRSARDRLPRMMSCSQGSRASAQCGGDAARPMDILKRILLKSPAAGVTFATLVGSGKRICDVLRSRRERCGRCGEGVPGMRWGRGCVHRWRRARVARLPGAVRTRGRRQHARTRDGISGYASCGRLSRPLAPHARWLSCERCGAGVPPLREPSALSQVGSRCVGGSAPGDHDCGG